MLIVGIGSRLRRDDAVGRLVADAVAELDLPGVEVRSVHQLVPELAATMVGRRRVVFVDATVSDSEVSERAVAAGPVDGPMTHHLDPAALVGLAGMLGDPPIEVLVVSVPAADLRIGTELSPASADAVREAVGRLVDLCRQ